MWNYQYADETVVTLCILSLLVHVYVFHTDWHLSNFMWTSIIIGTEITFSWHGIRVKTTEIRRYALLYRGLDIFRKTLLCYIFQVDIQNYENGLALIVSFYYMPTKQNLIRYQNKMIVIKLILEAAAENETNKCFQRSNLQNKFVSHGKSNA